MEHCDGANPGGKACVNEGFSGGVLACSPVCKFDTSGCASCGNGHHLPLGELQQLGEQPGRLHRDLLPEWGFIGPNTWSGVYSIGFSGPDCDCFGGLFGAPCINHVYPITAMR